VLGLPESADGGRKVQEPVNEGGVGAPFRALSDVARLVATETDIARVLAAVAGAVQSAVAADSVIVFEADHDLRVLRPVHVVDPAAKEIYLSVCRFGEGVSGEVAVSGQAEVVNEAHREPRARQIEGTPVEGAEALLCVPMVARGELRGVMNLYRTGGGVGFDDDDLAMAERFAELAALAMDDARLRARLQVESVIDRLTGLYNHRHFQERLADELRRSVQSGTPVSLILADVDGFQRVNDADGHVAGDRVLAAVAALCREAVRPGDLVCRVGGDEFAALLPATGLAEAAEVADAIRAKVSQAALGPAGAPVTLSTGVAEGPVHGADPHELMASANYALLQAKTAGHDRVSVYQAGEWSGVRAVPKGEAGMVRHLKVLQSVTATLNRLQDVRSIAHAILEQLGDLVEFHNCRIHLLDASGKTLHPVAFRGTLTEYEGETEEALITEIGEGITGRVALTGESIYAADANLCEFADQIPGTPVIDESILAVPLKFDDRVIGTIVLSKLGLNQFDADDLRLLESLASSAAVAFENARLFEEERQAADAGNALLRVSQALTRTRDPQRVLEEVVSSLCDLLAVPRASAWLRQRDGSFAPRAFTGYLPAEVAMAQELHVGPEIAKKYLLSNEEPFVMVPDVIAGIPVESRLSLESQPIVVAPFHWEPDGLAALVATAGDESRFFTDRDLRLARGVADLASLAMGNAARFAHLEEAFLQTVEVLANALEAKDETTGGHAREVADLAAAVGRELGMGEDDLRTVELAGMFHDIGKAGVGEGIATKPGPLSDTEMREMQRHPEIGASILEPVEFLQPVLPVIRAGHERWDGRGYPDGLAGEDIPLAARVLFVCDAYHAMTSDRSYRKALTEDEAVRRLQEASGTQFDPNVIRVFVEAHREGRIPRPSRVG
jgi:diguanylate cyclase (GGDEF)-like protein